MNGLVSPEEPPLTTITQLEKELEQPKTAEKKVHFVFGAKPGRHKPNAEVPKKLSTKRNQKSCKRRH